MIHSANKAAIWEFIRDLKLDGTSDAWLSKLTGHLLIIAEHRDDPPCKELDTNNVRDLVEWVQYPDVEERTVEASRQAIKRFWRWVYDLPAGEHPEKVDWMNTGGSSQANGTPLTDLLTREDVDALKEAYRNPPDRAFIAMLYETGSHIGELIDQTAGDIVQLTPG